MAIQQTAGTLLNSVRTAYGNRYIKAAELQRFYDQFATPYGAEGVERAAALDSTIQIPFISDMQVTETSISQVADINPQTLRDAVATLTPVSRGDAIQVSELMNLEAFTDYSAKQYELIGKNMMETVEVLAAAAALKGGNVVRATARTSLIGTTTSHNLNTLTFSQAEMRLIGNKCPAFVDNGRSQFLAACHPDAIYDIRTTGDVVNVAYYQDKEILFNNEFGSFGNFKIVTSPWGKVFAGAGAANASTQATTLSTAANALATTIIVATATNIVAGMWLNIGTSETGNTHYPMNERVMVSADYVSGSTINIIGEGANGGLRFPHASADVVNNDHSVYTVAFGSPSSLVKMYANNLGAGQPDTQSMGAYGAIVGPTYQGLANQWRALAWKFYGQYGRWVESWIVRAEVATRLVP
jgi:N4-gp56 family major capsid protein